MRRGHGEEEEGSLRPKTPDPTIKIDTGAVYSVMFAIRVCLLGSPGYIYNGPHVLWGGIDYPGLCTPAQTALSGFYGGKLPSVF